MSIRYTLFCCWSIVCFTLFTWVAKAQISPSMLQKAAAMGITQSDINAALSGGLGSSSGSGMGMLPQNLMGGSSMMNGQSKSSPLFLLPRDTAYRNNFTLEELQKINPQLLEQVITEMIDQEGYPVDARKMNTIRQNGGVPDVRMSENSDGSMRYGYDPTTANDYEIVIKDGKYIKRPLLSVFGREMFNNKNLTFSPNYNLATPQNYVLGAGDEVVVEVWGNSELQKKEKISPDGAIYIESIGLIQLGGLTIEQAEKRIRSKVGAVMSGAQVRVSLGQIRTIKVNIAGEVLVPGTYTLPSLATVFNALYVAGGVNRIGSLRSIKVYRNSQEIANLDVYDYLIYGKYETNIRLEDNDMIIVSPYDSYVAISGKIKRARVYELKKGETLSTLLDYAGGFMGDAYRDNVNVKRKTGRQYGIYTVDSVDFSGFVMSDGDSVLIDRVIDEYANRVTIAGAVWRPGEYELSDKLSTLSALLQKAEGLKGNEFASRGQITRRKSDYTKELISFNVREAALGTFDLSLMPEDSIYIPTILELREDYTVAVLGEVNRPNEMPYKEGMTVEDLILLGGGLKESASLARIEVARRIKDPSSTTYTSQASEIFTFTVTQDLAIAPEASRFVLHPFDQVYVRRSPGYRDQESVMAVGEVLYPGTYVLATAGDRISDLVRKCGGFTPEAYVKGASIKRKLTEDEKARVESMMKVARRTQGGGKDSLALDLDAYYPIGVDVEKAMATPGSANDIILREGDQLFVPKFMATVKISGMVNYPNSVVFERSSMRKYISQAGGYSTRARKRPFVIYMNGKVAATRTAFFSKSYPKVEPGCEIVVPLKPERSGRGLSNAMGVMTSTASMAAMIASIISISR